MRLLREFHNDRRGAIAVLFGIMMIPLMFLIAAGLDYGRRLSADTRLKAAADDAALGAILKMKEAVFAQNIAPGSAGAGALKTAAQEYGKNLFLSGAADVPALTNVSANVTIDVSGPVLTATAQYTANTTALFSGTIQFAGSATARLALPTYNKVYFLLDMSESMGVGATVDDQNKAFAKFGCTFTCHAWFDGGGTAGTETTPGTISDPSTTTYGKAKAAGIRTRFDVLQDAMKTMLDYAKNNGALKSDGKIKFGVYSFGNDIQTELDMADAAKNRNYTELSRAVSNLSLRREYYGTNFNVSFRNLAALLPQSGTGLLETDPLTTVVIVTDGIEDFLNSTRYGPRNHNHVDWSSAVRVPFRPWGPGWGIPQNMNPVLCKPFKDKKATVYILNVTYLWSNLNRNDTVGPFVTGTLLPKSADYMSQCASPGKFVSATTPEEISAGVIQILKDITEEARIVQ